MDFSSYYISGFLVVIAVILWFWIKKAEFRRRPGQLKNKVVLITGASSGLGEALTYMFCELGCRLILASRNVTALEKLKQRFIKLYGESVNEMIRIVPFDLMKMKSISYCEGIQMQISNCFGNVDIAIMNAGIGFRSRIIETDISTMRNIMYLNFFGHATLIKYILPQVRDRIVFINSVQGKLATPFRSAYTASKHALQAYADCLRAEVAAYNIHIMTVCPFYMRTKHSINALCGHGNLCGSMDDSTMEGYDPFYVAGKIYVAILDDVDELVVAPLWIRQAILMRTIFPKLYFKLIELRAI